MKCSTLKCFEDIPLSDRDITNSLGGEVSIAQYPEIHIFSNVDDLMGPYKAVVILFESKKNYGHWCCLFKLDDKTIEFFDPYGRATTGGYPDDNLRMIPKDFATISNQEYPYLSYLLDISQYDLTYNEIQFQKREKGIKTCGRHCVFRIENRDMSLYEYEDMMDDLCEEFNTNYDGVVTLFTI